MCIYIYIYTHTHLGMNMLREIFSSLSTYIYICIHIPVLIFVGVLFRDFTARFPKLLSSALPGWMEVGVNGLGTFSLGFIAV